MMQMVTRSKKTPQRLPLGRFIGVLLPIAGIFADLFVDGVQISAGMSAPDMPPPVAAATKVYRSKYLFWWEQLEISIQDLARLYWSRHPHLVEGIRRDLDNNYVAREGDLVLDRAHAQSVLNQIGFTRNWDHPDNQKKISIQDLAKLYWSSDPHTLVEGIQSALDNNYVRRYRDLVLDLVVRDRAHAQSVLDRIGFRRDRNHADNQNYIERHAGCPAPSQRERLQIEQAIAESLRTPEESGTAASRQHDPALSAEDAGVSMDVPEGDSHDGSAKSGSDETEVLFDDPEIAAIRAGPDLRSDLTTPLSEAEKRDLAELIRKLERGRDLDQTQLERFEELQNKSNGTEQQYQPKELYCDAMNFFFKKGTALKKMNTERKGCATTFCADFCNCEDEGMMVLSCGHYLCRRCAQYMLYDLEYKTHQIGNVPCPLCRQNIAASVEQKRAVEQIDAACR